ncbi:hypothetical protein [Thermosporothrix hazakensis]|jgi:hypothetical protein|nr:hypothetical protein [Thermosporothrix hazakensis]BBH89735.1 hypothetical protein KTC_44860 [Thermosporothrix sp. COM3]GCE47924.1 hypothetical protein KTH_27930 [Thermosporothrix hazakensis]
MRILTQEEREQATARAHRAMQRHYLLSCTRYANAISRDERAMWAQEAKDALSYLRYHTIPVQGQEGYLMPQNFRPFYIPEQHVIHRVFSFDLTKERPVLRKHHIKVKPYREKGLTPEGTPTYGYFSLFLPQTVRLEQHTEEKDDDMYCQLWEGEKKIGTIVRPSRFVVFHLVWEKEEVQNEA